MTKNVLGWGLRALGNCPEPRTQSPEQSLGRRALRMLVRLSLLAAVGCGPEMIGKDWKRIEPQVAAFDFTLPQLAGDPVNLSDYRGRVVIMEFWATWCGPCRFSLPSLEVIYKKYRDRGVSVLLVNEGETADEITRWAGKRFTAPILLDAQSDVAASYRVQGLPRLFVIGQDGNVLYEHEGYGGGLERSLSLILEQLVPQRASPTHA